MDREIAFLVAEFRSPVLTNIMEGISGLGTAIAAISFLYLFYRAGWKQEFLTGLGAHSLNGVIVAALMKLIERPFPPEPVCVTGFDAVTSSFPSGHAASAAVFAVIAWQSDKIATVPVTIIALLVAVSRVYLGTHYVSDTLFGFIMGLVIAYSVSKKLETVGYLYNGFVGRTGLLSEIK